MYQQILILRRKLLRMLPEWFWPRAITLDGVNIPLRGKPWSFGTKKVLQQGTYEAEERVLLNGIVKPGMQVIEMGSSIGILTAIIAEKIGATGRLISVEASEKLTRYSVPWLSRYPWVTVCTGFAFPVWQAEDVQVASFNEERGNLGGTVVFGDRSSILTAASVKIYGLKTIMDKFGVVPELLIVDVEGSEILMLSNPLHFPDSLQYLLIELHPGMYPRKKKDAIEIIGTICKEGFEQVNAIRGVYLFKRQSN